MGPLRAVVSAPGRDDFLGLLEVPEPMLVETLVAELFIEVFNVGISRRLSSPDYCAR